MHKAKKNIKNSNGKSQVTYIDRPFRKTPDFSSKTMKARIS